MSDAPKEHRLFHYLETLDYLREALTQGRWPRYFVEEFDWMLGNSFCIAFPVVCFCDIPIPAASAHRDRYGSYAIAIEKAAAGDYDINPVWYIQDDTSIEEHLAKSVAHPVRATLETIPAMMKPLLPYLKSTNGIQPDRQARTGTLECMAFEEELEWRYSPSSLMHTWVWDYNRFDVPADHQQLSVGHRLVFDPDDIDAIYVPTPAEAQALAAEFGHLAGKIQVWP